MLNDGSKQTGQTVFNFGWIDFYLIWNKTSHHFMASEIVTEKSQKTRYCKHFLIVFLFNFGHIPQSLKIMDTKIPSKSAIKSYVLSGSRYKFQLVKQIRYWFLWHKIQLFPEKFHKTTYKWSHSNQHLFQYV